MITENFSFNRYEFKYIVDNVIANKIQEKLQSYIRLDNFAKKQIKKSYKVISLYFDDNRYTAYHDKIDGLHTRQKFRLRCYSKNINNTPVYMEMKGRTNNFVVKKRTEIKDKNIYKKKGFDLTKDLANLYLYSNNLLLSRFMLFFNKKKIKPVALVEYERKPYISKFDDTFRITFDAKLQASQSYGLFEKNNKCFECLPGKSIIEIKFERYFPIWFYGIIQEFNLQRISISKICKSLETMNLTKDES